MTNKRRLMVAIAAVALIGLFKRPRHRSQLPPAQLRFLQRATLLEAQQVPLYHILSMHACRLGMAHLQAGYLRAMEVEANHLRDLKVAGRRWGADLLLWERIGDRLGRLSGGILTSLHYTVALRVVGAIEQVASREYANACSQADDASLRQLYMANQVDEECHRAWARLMLRELPRDSQPRPRQNED